ncbi:MAG: phage holin family protein [Sediminibacterium sp.]
MLLAFFAPIKGILITVGLLILIDTAFGVWKAKRLGEKLTSRGFSKIISKLLLYEMTVIMFYLIDTFMLGDILKGFFSIENLLTKAVGLILASVEVFSIDESWRAVKKYGLWDAAKKLLARSKEAKAELKDFDLDNFTK